jgi:hypothetical protein
MEAHPEIPARTRSSLSRPTFAQRLQWRRRVAVELDHLLGLWKYPDPSELYAIAPLRERIPGDQGLSAYASDNEDDLPPIDWPLDSAHTEAVPLEAVVATPPRGPLCARRRVPARGRLGGKGRTGARLSDSPSWRCSRCYDLRHNDARLTDRGPRIPPNPVLIGS